MVMSFVRGVDFKSTASGRLPRSDVITASNSPPLNAIIIKIKVLFYKIINELTFAETSVFSNINLFTGLYII